MFERGNGALYGITEAAVLAAGYAPAIGFIHTGKPLSFVYDIADLFKFETVVPIAFQVAARDPMANPLTYEQDVRYSCREVFRSTRLLQRIIPVIEDVLAAGGCLNPSLPRMPCLRRFLKRRGWPMMVIVLENASRATCGGVLPSGCWK